MKDTIYRQEAIDALCDNCNNVQAVCPHYPCKQYIAVEKLPSAQPERDTGYSDGFADGYKQGMKDAQPEQRWIPCSDRYPNMDERVLVYTVAHEYHVWDCMSNRADNYFWEDEAGLYHDKYEVDLWLPLPEPYQAERRTDGEIH